MAKWTMVFQFNLLLVIFLVIRFSEASGHNMFGMFRSTNDKQEGNSSIWAILVAGSKGYDNYRHQADVCHAYQILTKGGLKDENIIVFMYDDIANNPSNPRPGVIINNPKGSDVYAGVPKDYTGKSVTAANLYAVLLGNKTAVKGGSGKVVASNHNDKIFIYYSDHGGAGLLGMPNMPFVYATDLINVLKIMHARNTYDEMVIYIEACQGGSIFQGLLPEDLNIYVTTASNSIEDSWATYCADTKPPSPPEFDTCLGDLYSISWMEDSESEDLRHETLEQQYLKVKKRTYNNNSYQGSHVMEFGTLRINNETVSVYQGSTPRNFSVNPGPSFSSVGVVDQRNADLYSMWQKYKKSTEESQKKELLKKINEIKSYRVRTFETYCGSLTQYGMKHSRTFANICNNGVTKKAMDKAIKETCSSHKMGKWDPKIIGYSA
ncbi:unnamed protein product [Lactuca virosa]|uniref:Legumain prodomain domain-containing protein n=1 Tax=Lactuca virosa TaxID=75947 RepID=A0AAU9N9F3_9ASTR|nr:unnamed protein product [Lactuca virosa]